MQGSSQTLNRYLEENITSNTKFIKRVLDENSTCDQCGKDILKGEEF